MINKYIGVTSNLQLFSKAVENNEINLVDNEFVVQKGTLAERYVSRQISNTNSLADRILNLILTIFSCKYRQAKEIVARNLEGFKVSMNINPYPFLFKHFMNQKLQKINCIEDSNEMDALKQETNNEISLLNLEEAQWIAEKLQIQAKKLKDAAKKLKAEAKKSTVEDNKPTVNANKPKAKAKKPTHPKKSERRPKKVNLDSKLHEIYQVTKLENAGKKIEDADQMVKNAEENLKKSSSNDAKKKKLELDCYSALRDIAIFESTIVNATLKMEDAVKKMDSSNAKIDLFNRRKAELQNSLQNSELGQNEEEKNTINTEILDLEKQLEKFGNEIKNSKIYITQAQNSIEESNKQITMANTQIKNLQVEISKSK
jgi:hypothetical protein